MQLVNIGFGSLISVERLIAVVSPDSAPVKRLVQEARDRGMLTDIVNANMVAVYRLATGRDLRLNCSANTVMTAAAGANLAWAEVGTNPRDTVERTEHGGRGGNIKQLRKMLAASDWKVLEGPSTGWML